jgi:hypothetical protein
MKSVIQAVVVAGVLAVPVASFAQQAAAPLTRAQVRAELVQLEQAGYNPANANTVDFPTNIQLAVAPAVGQDSGEGFAVSGSSQSGRPTSTNGMKPVFFGH